MTSSRAVPPFSDLVAPTVDQFLEAKLHRPAQTGQLGPAGPSGRRSGSSCPPSRHPRRCAGRLRQDHPDGPMDGQPRPAAHCLGVTRQRRQRSQPSVDARRRGSGANRLRPPLQRSFAAGGCRHRHRHTARPARPGERSRGHARRHRARSRRLPLHPRPRLPRTGPVPDRAPARPGAPGHRHPLRPRPASGQASGLQRPGRDPSRRPPLHQAGGDRAAGQRSRAAGRRDRLPADGAHRGLAGGPLPGDVVAGRTGRPGRLRAEVQRREPLHR